MQKVRETFDSREVQITGIIVGKSKTKKGYFVIASYIS